jgi:hypothetical protein
MTNVDSVPSGNNALVVGPSARRADWQKFFAARKWEPTEFAQLIRSDSIGAAFFEIETQINGLYSAAEQALTLQQRFGIAVDQARLGEIRFKARWLNANAEPLRQALGPRQRDLDLGLMGWMRRASCLSAVIGAGATMDAGGPSWQELVRRLLILVLERGRENYEMRPTPESTPENREYRPFLTGTERLKPDAERRARALLSRIDASSVDTESLMEGAQICYDLLGQHLFTDLSQIVYENARQPGAIHRAIAELAPPIHVPDRGGWFPGWASIITYNFDDFMGEVLDATALARAAYAMRGDEIAGDPNELARKAGRNGLHQPIYHLHGYTPRRPFLITQVRFVFSTSQYERTYGNSRAAIIGEVFERWLARPIHHALYVGCSFQDEAMNALLRDAADALPGRYHYALLKWPGPERFEEASADEVAVASARYVAMGVRPIWFNQFSEIPDLIRRLA